MHSAIIAARSRVFHRKSLLRLFSAVFIASLIMLPAGALAAAEGNDSGFKTAQPSMLTAVMPGVEITLLLRIPGL